MEATHGSDCRDLATRHGFDKEAAIELLAKLIARNLLSIQLLDDTDFRVLITHLDPLFVLPSREDMERVVLPETRRKIESEMLEKISTIKTFSLYTESRIDDQGHGYKTIGCYGVSDDWRFWTFLLDLIPLTPTQTLETDDIIIKDTIRRWGISDAQVISITDTASTTKHGHLDIPLIPCFSQVISASLQKAFDMCDAGKTVQKVEKIYRTSVTPSVTGQIGRASCRERV